MTTSLSSLKYLRFDAQSIVEPWRAHINDLLLAKPPMIEANSHIYALNSVLFGPTGAELAQGFATAPNPIFLENLLRGFITNPLQDEILRQSRSLQHVFDQAAAVVTNPFVSSRVAELSQLMEEQFNAASRAHSVQSIIARQFEDAMRLPEQSLINAYGQFKTPAAILAEFTQESSAASALDALALSNRSYLDTFRQAEEAASLAAKWAHASHIESLSDLLQGKADLLSMGRAVNCMSAYGDPLSSFIRSGLGDWRDTIDWPKNIFTDAVARSDFYESRGFDRSLTGFSAPVFEQLMRISGLVREPQPFIDYNDERIERSDNFNGDDDLARNSRAFDRLERLEISVRQFINQKMTEHFGPDWPKYRLPNGLYDEWLLKKDKHLKAGGSDWLLVFFADFTDYEKVICKRDNWREVFEPFFIRMETVREFFQRLYPVRLNTMHARLITRDDLLFLHVEVMRLSRVID